MLASIQRYVRSCLQCQRNKHSVRKPPGLLQPLPVPVGRWTSIAMDFITDLPGCLSESRKVHQIWTEFVSSLCRSMPQPQNSRRRFSAAIFLSTGCQPKSYQIGIQSSLPVFGLSSSRSLERSLDVIMLMVDRTIGFNTRV